MYNKSKYNNFKGYFCIIIYNITMLFYQYIGKPMVITLGLLFITWFILTNKKKWNIFQLLSYLLCIFIPTSFVSILGTSYGSLPLTWFNLTTISLFVFILFKGIRINYFFFATIIMMIFGLISLTRSVDLVDSSKQLLTIILFLLSFFIGEFLRRYSNNSYNEKLKSYYLLGVFSFSIIVILQKLLIGFNISVGYYTVVGNGREVFAGLLNDYSFATLYIATGAVLLMIDYFDGKSIRTPNFFMGQIFLLITILVVNSRTGLIALFITLLIFLIRKIIQRRIKALLLITLFLTMIPFILSSVVENRGGQAFFDGSGRFELISKAFEVFIQHPIMGVGFGLNNLYINTGMHVPHNLIAQYLAQFGMVGSIIFFTFFIVMFFKYYKFRSNYLWVLFAILLGAMFIPDIVSSRFLSVLIILTIISSINSEHKVIVKE